MDWLRWTSTAAFLAVAGYCVVRLVAAARAPAVYHGCHRAIDLAHVLMGVGMAAMVSPVGGPLPMAAWQTVFLLMTAWFVGAWWRDRGTTPWHGGWHGGGLHHAMAAAAMLYMLLAMPHSGHMSSPWMSGSGMGAGMGAGVGLPVLGWGLTAYFVVSAVLMVTRWHAPAGPPGLPPLLATSKVTAACQTTMSAGTGGMLLAMLTVA